LFGGYEDAGKKFIKDMDKKGAKIATVNKDGMFQKPILKYIIGTK
tara:strand:- start:528 stop:662 length:135 start_codon:yes stop_codon:yes gene_type:complete